MYILCIYSNKRVKNKLLPFLSKIAIFCLCQLKKANSYLLLENTVLTGITEIA